MTWTQFMDMHSGGGTKHKYEYIYIEAPENEARVIFYNRFGTSPDRVSCTCCGEDYSVTESTTLEQATAYNRGCRYISEGNARGRYLEHGEPVPDGWKLSGFQGFHDKQLTLAEYIETSGVHIIRDSDVRPGERVGSVPEQGFVWQD